LHNAANKEVAELLIAHGADVNAKNKQCKSPLHAAMARNNQDVVKLLIAHGANQR
jgi:ankyrin repeat protein